LSQLAQLRQCERPVTVDAGLTTCSSCVRGRCSASFACHLPEPDAPRGASRRIEAFLERGCAACAVIAAGGFGLFIGAALRHFFY
jgi:hypothetical protein